MNEQIQNSYELILGKIESWFTSAITIFPNFVVAVVVLVAFYFIARLTRKLFLRFLAKVSGNRTITSLFSTISFIAVLTAGVFIALGVLKLEKTVTSLLAGVGIVGLAIGFAFQDIASNFIAGIILSVRKPFLAGDLVETNGYFGHIDEINLRTTVLTTLQGLTVIIPNKLVFENSMTNYTRTSDRRIDLECGVSYGDDLRKVFEITKKALQDLPKQNTSKEVEVFFKEFGSSSINYQARFWITSATQKDYLYALSEAVMKVHEAYNQNDITIPFPIRTLDFGIKGGEKLNEVWGRTASPRGPSEGS